MTETDSAPRFTDGRVTLTGSGGVARIAFTAPPPGSAHSSLVDAVGKAVDWAFLRGGFETIVWSAAAGDLDGWRAAWHHGFTFDGKVRKASEGAVGLVDTWQATLLRDDSREPKTTWFEPVRIEHVGVVLRDVLDGDEDRFVATLNDPESLQWLGTIPGLARTSEAFRAAMSYRLLNASLGRAINWTVADPYDDAYLATITLFELDGLDYKSGEVGYRTHPDARGRGVLTSALRAVIAHAFTPLEAGGIGLERIQLLAGEGNTASLGVARSCGFTEVGRDRQCYDLYDGRVVDLIRFDLLRSEFQPG